MVRIKKLRMKIIDSFLARYNWYRRIFKKEIWIYQLTNKYNHGGIDDYRRYSEIHNRVSTVKWESKIKQDPYYLEPFIGKDIYDPSVIISWLSDKRKEANQMDRVIKIYKLIGINEDE